VDALLFLDIRAVAVSLHRRCRAHFLYRAATFNLNHTFPDAAPADLARHDGDCAICRDGLQAGKLLPCGHVFHLSCLRAWLQQSGSDNFTCPNCRLPLFLADGKRAPDQHAGDGAAEPQRPHLLARLLAATLTSAAGGGDSPRGHHHHHHHHQHGGYAQGYGGAEDASSAPGYSSEEWEQHEGLEPSDVLGQLEGEEEGEEEGSREGLAMQQQQQQQLLHAAGPEAAAEQQPAAAVAAPARAAAAEARPASSSQGGGEPLPAAQPSIWRSTSDVTASRLAAAATRSCSREPSTFTGDTLPQALQSLSQKVRQSISGAAGAAVAAAAEEEGDEADSSAVIRRARAGAGEQRSERARRASARRRQGGAGGAGEAAEAAAGSSRQGPRRRSTRAEEPIPEEH
jgi:hypothetical protein